VFYASLKIVGKLAAVLDVEPAELLRLKIGVRDASEDKPQPNVIRDMNL